MNRIAGMVCALLLLAVAGCGDDDAATATTTTTTAETTTTTEGEPDELALVDDPVDGFDERTVTFGNLTYTVLDAHVTNQDLRSYAEGTEAEATPTTHLILDVRVANPTGRQIESDGDAIALDLDGASIGVADDFLTDATGFIGANESVDDFLAFEVDADAAVADAVVVFGIDPDRPTRLPLTGTVPEPGFPIEVATTGTAEGTGPTNGGTISFEVLGATLFEDLPHGDATSPTGERADVGEVFVQIHVQATKVDGRGNDLLSDQAFRLLVDGVARSPFDVATAPEGSASTPTAEPDATVDAWVLFAVDADADTYVLQVGDQAEAPGAIPIELPDR